MKTLRLSALILFLFASCVLPSEPNSAVRLKRSWGLAGAQNAEEAEHLAGIVDEILPKLRELGGFEERSLRIHISEDLGKDGIEGITIESRFSGAWIAVRGGRPEMKNTVAHEMVHFYFDPLMSRFSNLFQEGMAEYMACEIHPAFKRRKRMLVFVAASYLENFTIEVHGAKAKARLPYLVEKVPTVEELFELDWYDTLTAEPRVSETIYGLGLLMAERIGWDGMLELAERATSEGLETVPAEWVRAAAGLEPATRDNIRAAILKALAIKGEGEAGDFRIILSD